MDTDNRKAPFQGWNGGDVTSRFKNINLRVKYAGRTTIYLFWTSTSYALEHVPLNKTEQKTELLFRCSVYSVFKP